MQEFIVYKDYGRIRWQPSEENGVFPERVRLDTGSDEGPRLMIYSSMFGFDKVRVMDEETKREFLELERQIKDLQNKRNALIETNWGSKMTPLTWDWMKQHQDPTIPVPELFQHKTKVVSLRRGSKVMVDGSTDAVRWRIACQVGRLKRKGKKWATVEFEDKRLRYVPYTVLLPYDYQTLLREKRRAKDSERLNRMSAQVTRQLNKILA